MMKRFLLALAAVLVAASASAQLIVKKGTTDVTAYVVLVDSTTGAPETGLTITGLDLQYVRYRTAPSTKADATALAATDSAHTDNACIEIDATDQPGLYRCDFPDAAFATGAPSVVLSIVATGVRAEHLEYQLVDFDPQDNVRLGLTALPNAAADAAGGLPISDAGGLDLDARLDAAVSSRLAPTTAGRTLDVTATGEAGIDLDNTAGTLAKTTDITGFNDLSAAQVNDEVDTGINDARLNQLLVADSDIDGAAPPTVGSVFFELMSASAGSFTFSQTLDSLEGISDGVVDLQGRLPPSLVGGRIDANVGAISGDVSAADNLESEFDGTGWTGAYFVRAAADGGSSTSITLHATASSTTDFYKWSQVQIVAGTGAGQARTIIAYNGTTKVADVDMPWVTAPIAGSTFALRPWGSVNLYAISEDATAATNAESFFDGTGYAGTGNTIPTVTTVGSVTGSVGSVTGAVGSVTGNVGGNVVGSIGSLATQAKADVNAEVDASVETYHLDHLLATTYDPASKPGAADALLNELVENDGGVSRYTVNALENAPSGSGASAETIADAVWDEDIVAAHATADTAGLILSQLTKRSVTFSTAAVQGSIVRQLADDGTATYDRTTDSQQAIADSGGGGLTQQQVRDAMKLAPTGGAPAAGSVDEHLDDTLADTNELQANQNWNVWDDGARTLTALDEDTTTIDLDATPVGSVAGNVGGNVVGSTASVTGNVGGNVVGSIGSLAAQAKADVNAEVDLALDTAVPGTPTAGSINERVKTMDDADIPAAVSNISGRLPFELASGLMKSRVDGFATTGLAPLFTVDSGQTYATAIAGSVVAEIANNVQMSDIKKNTAFSNFTFLMVQSADHITPATGLTVSGQRTCDGAALTAVTGTIAEIGSGLYQFDAAAADTNCDAFAWVFTAAGADARYFSFKTKP